METWSDILLLASIVACVMISVAALIAFCIGWWAQREYRRTRENFQRRLRQ